jgi:hypothetical protein
MALKHPFARTVSGGGLLLILFVYAFFNLFSGVAWRNSKAVHPDFTNFVNLVENGNVSVLSGVYIPNVLALPVVQQPSGNDGFVSNTNGQVTQFALASQYGNIGLLAHNYLSGKSFSQIQIGQEVRLVYGDRTVKYFIVREVLQYQAMEPNSPWSSFRDINDNTILNAEQMFNRVYAGEPHVTFQTCIQAEGISTWGRLFVVAEPKTGFSAAELFGNLFH